MSRKECETDPRVCARIGELLDIALELPAEERGAWLCGLQSEDALYKEKLAHLLSQAPALESGGFLSTLPKLGFTEAGASTSCPNDIVGPYRLLREIGAGGMGSVWLAERVDGLLKRPVALKLPHGIWRAGLSERMAYEREIVASLNHPYIARLYDAGLTAVGQPYLAFEYVEGKALDSYCREEGMRIDARLRLFLQVVAAVAHAHANLVVHRDLKPSNILVTSDGQVRLLDFGIAKLLDKDPARGTNLSQLWGCVLTPDYAAPEQIAGEPLTICSDIYSLGVLLFELVAGQHPYRSVGDSRRAIERAILHDDPPRPRDVIAPSRRHELKRDLEVIILKALKKLPHERYATADALGEDIERYLAGKPVAAQEDSAWYRLSKLLGRHRWAAGMMALVSLAILCATAMALWQRHAALTEARRAQDIKQILTSVLSGAGPYAGEGQARTIGDVLDVVQREVDRVPPSQSALRVELLTIVGTAELNQQNTASAERVLNHARDEARRRLGPQHPLTIRARVASLPLYRFRGRTALSRQEIDSLLPILRANVKVFAPELVVALRNKAHLEVDAGDPAAAFAAASEASKVATERLGADHPEVVSAELMVAFTAQYYSDPHTALEYAHRAMTLAQHRFAENPQHPRIIEAEFLLGRALGGVGRFAEGAAQLQLAVEHSERIFGTSSRKVGSFLVDLARFQLLAGDSQRALQSSERAVAIISKHVDPDSVRFVAALAMRGRCLLAEHHEQAGRQDLQRAARIMERIASSGGESGMSAQRSLDLAMTAREQIILRRSLIAQDQHPCKPGKQSEGC
jgi:serine/threonine-protein kinase